MGPSGPGLGTELTHVFQVPVKASLQQAMPRCPVWLKAALQVGPHRGPASHEAWVYEVKPWVLALTCSCSDGWTSPGPGHGQSPVPK